MDPGVVFVVTFGSGSSAYLPSIHCVLVRFYETLSITDI